MKELQDYQLKDIKKMRKQARLKLIFYSDLTIRNAYAEYSDYFHAAEWAGNENFLHFIKWATTTPLKRRKNASKHRRSP